MIQVPNEAGLLDLKPGHWLATGSVQGDYWVITKEYFEANYEQVPV